MSIRLTNAEIDHLVHRFDILDLEQWDRGAMERAAAGLGWRLRSELAEGLTFIGPLPDGWNFAYRGHVHGSPREGAFTMLECELARTGETAVLTEVFLAAKAAAEKRIGPAPIWRGPGPVLRWRRPETLLEIERTGNTVRLRLLPADVAENHEYQLAKWGERDDAVAEIGVWQATTTEGAALEGVFVPGGHLAETWDEFGEWLEETLAALSGAMGPLDQEVVLVMAPVTDRYPGFVQLRCDARLLHLEAGTEGLDPRKAAELGWQQDDAENLVHVIDFGHPRPSDIEAAARVLVNTLRVQDVPLDDLHCTAWLGKGGYSLDLYGLGIPQN
ncbi:DUF6301 family protein [Spirillospora sp. NBC_01491]|uniref:DUF6301 family protein n=1 Tax=Spirillospora sp. NBC_01491 TaxID=2976007 RepID=UPI002E31E822|nr:DUF6301 family protein [Spirillospora sp. NBC_01491]